jgi:DNA-binding transcriptional regulator GbsR (MarR family)
MSLDDLAKAVGASKASISQEARRCESLGVLERVSKSGDRRDYYRVPDELFVRTMEMRLARWKAFHEVVSTGRKSLKLRNQDVLSRLDDFDAAFEHISGALSRAIDEWRSRSSRSRRSA